MMSRALLGSLLAAVATASAAAVASVLDGSAVVVFTASLVVAVLGVVLSSSHLARQQRLHAETLTLRDRNDTLREGKLLAEGTLDGLDAAVLLVGRSGRVEFANAAARRLLRGGARLGGKPLQNLIDGAPAGVRAAFEDPALPGFDAAWGDDKAAPWTLARRSVRHGAETGVLYVAVPLTREARMREARTRRQAARAVAEALAGSLGDLPVTAAVAEQLEEALAPFRREPPTPRQTQWHPFLEGLRAQTSFALPAPAPAKAGWFDPDRLGEALQAVLSSSKAEGRQVEVREDGEAFELIVRGHGVSEDSTLWEVVEDHGGEVDVLVGDEQGRGELRVRLPMP
jgi:PAS domain-containing protein